MTVKTEYLTVWVSDDIKDEPETAAFLDMIARKTEENGKNVPIFSNKEVEDSNKQNKNPPIVFLLVGFFYVRSWNKGPGNIIILKLTILLYIAAAITSHYSIGQ